MKSLVLVVEHRRCSCGASFLAPNPRALSRRELENLRITNAEIYSNGPRRDTYHAVPYVPTREILHIDVKIEYCPQCFKTSNGRQFDLFPTEEPAPLIFVGVRGKPITLGGAHVENKKPPKPNPYGLHYF